MEGCKIFRLFTSAAKNFVLCAKIKEDFPEKWMYMAFVSTMNASDVREKEIEEKGES